MSKVLTGWFPTAFYFHNKGLCGFNHPLAVIPLDKFYKTIYSTIGEFSFFFVEI